MFQINSYLQFRNTPDGKPRVLREEIDYTNSYNNQLVDTIRLTYVTGKVDDYEAVAGMMKVVANLSDCRPLLSVEIVGKTWIINSTVFESPFGFYALFDNLYLGGYLSAGSYGKDDINNSKILGSFFDDPAKYSKLLWNCSKEEGWDKVFKLLGIEI